MVALLLVFSALVALWGGLLRLRRHAGPGSGAE